MWFEGTFKGTLSSAPALNGCEYQELSGHPQPSQKHKLAAKQSLQNTQKANAFTERQRERERARDRDKDKAKDRERQRERESERDVLPQPRRGYAGTFS